MKINKIKGLLIASLVLLFTACDPIVDEQYLENTTDVDGVELSATQSTVGGNEITLDLVTPGVTGYWDYNLGKALTDKVTFIYPIPGTATFTFVGTLGGELFTKTIDVQIDQLDHALNQDWYDLVSEDTAAGKTWVFNGTGPDTGDMYYWMSPPGDPGSWEGVWWNAGGTCCPPPDVNGKMKFDLDGAANYTYESGPGATPEAASFVLDVDNQKLIINDSNILGGADAGQGGYNPSAVYDIVSLTEDELILYYGAGQWGSGWTWVFRPE